LSFAKGRSQRLDQRVAKSWGATGEIPSRLFIWDLIYLDVIPGRAKREPGISTFRVQPCGLPRNDK
jgi:hypothetical protein